MIAPPQDLRAALADAVGAYEASGNMGALMKRLHELRDSVMPDALVSAAEPWLHMPEVAGPLYERIVQDQPKNARAMVILANAYWLSGRGPEIVGDLAARALGVDPENRGAWHMWRSPKAIRVIAPRGGCRSRIASRPISSRRPRSQTTRHR